jgi:hypothetical protein
MLITAVLGPQLWSLSLKAQTGLDVSYGEAYLSLGVLGALLGAFSSARRVMQCVQRGTTTAAQAALRLLPRAWFFFLLLLLFLVCTLV